MNEIIHRYFFIKTETLKHNSTSLDLNGSSDNIIFYAWLYILFIIVCIVFSALTFFICISYNTCQEKRSNYSNRLNRRNRENRISEQEDNQHTNYQSINSSNHSPSEKLLQFQQKHFYKPTDDMFTGVI